MGHYRILLCFAFTNAIKHVSYGHCYLGDYFNSLTSVKVHMNLNTKNEFMLNPVQKKPTLLPKNLFTKVGEEWMTFVPLNLMKLIYSENIILAKIKKKKYQEIM